MKCFQPKMGKAPSAVTNETSARIGTMSFLCALLVILIHTDRAPIEGTLSASLFSMGFIITRIAVPFFFCVAGYFLAGHTCDQGWYRKETKKRIQTLLIPMWLGSLITFIWSVPLILLANVYHNEPLLRNFPQNILDFLTIAGLNPLENPLTPFWFLRTLFVFVVLSPILVLFIKRSRHSAIGCVLLTYCAYSVFTCSVANGDFQDESWLKELLTWLFSLRDLFFFTVGIALRYYPIHLSKKFTARLFFGLIALLVVIASWYFHIKVFIFLPILTLCIYLAMPVKALSSFLIKNTFAIYLLHMLPLSLVNLIIKNVPSLSFIQTSVLGWLTVGSCIMLVCVITSNVLRKTFPRFSKLLLGGR